MLACVGGTENTSSSLLLNFCDLECTKFMFNQICLQEMFSFLGLLVSASRLRCLSLFSCFPNLFRSTFSISCLGISVYSLYNILFRHVSRLPNDRVLLRLLWHFYRLICSTIQCYFAKSVCSTFGIIGMTALATL